MAKTQFKCNIILCASCNSASSDSNLPYLGHNSLCKDQASDIAKAVERSGYNRKANKILPGNSQGWKSKPSTFDK